MNGVSACRRLLLLDSAEKCKKSSRIFEKG
jgi:hypothetical protein